MRQKITQTHTHQSYRLGRDVYDERIKREDAKRELVSKYGMNESSAAYYLDDFCLMMDGRQYDRTMNAYSTIYFIENIKKDFGEARFQLALSALEQHLNYYESIKGGGPNKRVRDFLKSQKNKIIIEKIYPDEIDEPSSLMEGAQKQVVVNAYERNPKARKKCLEHYGYKCRACKFDFAKQYGEIGKDFIHVHHVVEISTVKAEYKVDPIKDLRPVCPNCHAMLHRAKPALTLEKLIEILRENAA